MRPPRRRANAKKGHGGTADHDAAAALLDWGREALGHAFGDVTLLIQAVTHRSLVGADYQRLEFLGDRVLGCVIAAWIYARYPDEPEGKLSKRYAELVRKETCAGVARACHAGNVVRLQKNAASAGLHQADNLLGDVCEALIGALYLDGGMTAAEGFIRARWHDLIDGASNAVPLDAKSALQEWAQARGLPLPAYALVNRSGPDHAPTFEISVTVAGYPPATAAGVAKADAEKAAATKLLQDIAP